MSVIYDQLKRVEETQVEEAPLPKEQDGLQKLQEVKLMPEGQEVPAEQEAAEGQEENLPLQEELQYQKDEKWNKTKSYLIKGGSVLGALGAAAIAFFLFTSTSSKPVAKLSVSPVSKEVAVKTTVVVPPTTGTVKFDFPQKAMHKRLAKHEAVKPAVPVIVAHESAEKPKEVLAEKNKTATKQKNVLAKANKIVLPKEVLPKVSSQKTQPEKLSPEILAKAQKQLPPIQAAQHFYQAGKLNEAIKFYEQAVEEDSKLLEAYNNLGVLYTRKGFSKKAELNFRRALKVNPYYAEAHFNYAVLLEKEQKNKQALGHYLKFVEYSRPKQKALVQKTKEHIDLD